MGGKNTSTTSSDGVNFKFTKKKTTAAGRAKEGARIGGVLGAIGGGLVSKSMFKGAAIGAIAVGGVHAAMNAAFGRRVKHGIKITNLKKNKTGMSK
jgi:hypothetical protein